MPFPPDASHLQDPQKIRLPLRGDTVPAKRYLSVRRSIRQCRIA